MYDYENDKYIHSIDLEKLKQCQDNPLVLSTFAKYFLKFISNDYAYYVERIKEAFYQQREKSTQDDDDDDSTNYNRLDDTSTIILIALYLFYMYIQHINQEYDNSISTKSKCAQNIIKSFKPELKTIDIQNLDYYLPNISDYQREIIRLSNFKNTGSTINLCKILLDLIDLNYIDEYDKYLENNDIFKKNKTLYLNPNYFLKLLNKNKIYNENGQAFTYHQIVQYFSSHNIIKLKNQNLNTYRKDDTYYLALSIKKLKNEAKNNYIYRINSYLR